MFQQELCDFFVCETPASCLMCPSQGKDQTLSKKPVLCLLPVPPIFAPQSCHAQSHLFRVSLVADEAALPLLGFDKPRHFLCFIGHCLCFLNHVNIILLFLTTHQLNIEHFVCHVQTTWCIFAFLYLSSVVSLFAPAF